MAFDLAVEVQRVRACAAKRDTRSRQVVDKALQSKWEGLQSVALQVLGEWGDDDSRSRLRDFIEEVEERQYGWAIRGVAIRALAACVKPDDAPWVLNRYFRVPGVLAKHELLPLVVSLPTDVTRNRLLHEISARNRDDRQAAMKAIGSAGFEDGANLLQRFADDEDADIRRGANVLIARLTDAS